MSDQTDGPTIILIGGNVTLDSGAQIDTRRALEGDDWDFTLRASLGGSEAFWRIAKDLTDIILEQSTASDPWAFAWVNKTIKRPKPDGTFTRVRTVKYLDNADQLMDLQASSTEGLLDTKDLRSRYRILPAYLRFDDVRTAADPVAFVGAFHTSYDDGTDIIGLAPLALVLSMWPNAVLVLPHTPLIEDKARQLLEWHRQGAEPPRRDQYGSVGLAALNDSARSDQFVAGFEATAELRAADPYVIDDALRVSFWADRGTVKDAADLDAAFGFIMSRYDLSFGLWDLARDRVLRESLLDPVALAPTLDEPVSVPSELAESAAEGVVDRQEAQATEAVARAKIHEMIWPRLEEQGWSIPGWKDSGTDYTLSIGPELGSPYPNVDTSPVVYFSLNILKKQAALRLSAITTSSVVEDLLTANAKAINGLTGHTPDQNTVLRMGGRGWDGETEGWNAHLDTVLECVALLKPQLTPVIDDATEFRNDQLASLEPLEVTVSVDVKPPPTRPKRSRWRRLLERD